MGNEFPALMNEGERELERLLHIIVERLATIEESLLIILQKLSPTAPEPTAIQFQQNR
jgi:hypothetical protein